MKKIRGIVCGVGINDADYNVTRREKVGGKWKNVWKCPYYRKWLGMLQRCYSKKIQERQPTYKGCTVCEEWLLFSTFKRWMEEQEWEGRQLDKDFLVDGNKVYSPTTCVFIPQKLNSFVISCGKSRGFLPLGVRYTEKPKHMINELTKPYRSQINNQTGESVHIGCYSTPEEAHQGYLVEKLKMCEEYLIEFGDEELVVKGLTRIRNKIKHHIDNNLELTSY